MGLSIAICVRVGTALGAADSVQAKRSAVSGVLCTGGWGTPGKLERGRDQGISSKKLAGNQVDLPNLIFLFLVLAVPEHCPLSTAYVYLS